ncbi:PilZ domain-containing protein [Stutzerimonas azotifigens]|uniref:PilZ domain-containing protein n=1 Tax=Stutzerimonas azotifigens TaxID=291995 RepID=A0ABR5YVX2_9GAMM|nr:PilZ domain-containing protein [Stutzerimonas azotifigens]MBA1272066.1 PilZ domain-containing protein [Stutzerimonas azotifigens]
MADDSILSSDELEFINSLMNPPTVGQPSNTPTFRVDGGPQSNQMLSTLAQHSKLTFDAQFDDFCMSFPLQLAKDEFHVLQLRMAAPVIYERGPVLRAWRFHPDKPLPLLEADGGRSSLSVHELSPSGLLVDTSRKRNTPDYFQLRLALPGGDTLPLEARRVRDVDEGMTAYEVDYPEQKDAERIRRYLFRQHRRLHPELQPEMPLDLV